MNEKSDGNILIYEILYKNEIVPKQCFISSIKLMNLLEFTIELDSIVFSYYDATCYRIKYTRLHMSSLIMQKV